MFRFKHTTLEDMNKTASFIRGRFYL